jgi:hypothetical protein
MVFFNAASFASCWQAKEIAGFGYSDSAVAYDLEIFAAERAGDAKLVAELEAKPEAAINAYGVDACPIRNHPTSFRFHRLTKGSRRGCCDQTGQVPTNQGRGVPAKPAEPDLARARLRSSANS